MKKIGKRKGDITIAGMSVYDGIIFSASRQLDEVFNLEGPEVKAQQNYAEVIINSEVEVEKTRKVMSKGRNDKVLKVSFVVAAASIVLGIVSIFAFEQLNYFFRWTLIMSFAVMRGPAIISMFFMNHVTKSKKIRSLARFHGAEHAAINAFYDLERVPTLEEIKKYSMFSTRCGSLPQVSGIGIFALVSFAAFSPSGSYAIVFLILALIGFLLKKVNAWVFMEFLVVSRPTDFEYNIAIKGISKALEALEEYGKPKFSGGNIVIAINIGFDDSENSTNK